MVLFSTPVSTFLSSTLALGTTAPLESRTAPLNEAVDSCANPVPDSKRMLLRRHACHRATPQVFHHSTENFISRILALREALYIASTSERTLIIRVRMINCRQPSGPDCQVVFLVGGDHRRAK